MYNQWFDCFLSRQSQLITKDAAKEAPTLIHQIPLLCKTTRMRGFWILLLMFCSDVESINSVTHSSFKNHHRRSDSNQYGCGCWWSIYHHRSDSLCWLASCWSMIDPEGNNFQNNSCRCCATQFVWILPQGRYICNKHPGLLYFTLHCQLLRDLWTLV